MSDDAVDKFFDEMVSPASTPTESTTPDEADKPGNRIRSWTTPRDGTSRSMDRPPRVA